MQLHRQPKRLGKTAGQNAAVERATGEIILFSDATTHYNPNVLRAIVPSFADPTVGCVAGRLIYVDPSASTIGQGARLLGLRNIFEAARAVCSLIGLWLFVRCSSLGLCTSLPRSVQRFHHRNQDGRAGPARCFRGERGCTEDKPAH